MTFIVHQFVIRSAVLIGYALPFKTKGIIQSALYLLAFGCLKLHQEMERRSLPT